MLLSLSLVGVVHAWSAVIIVFFLVLTLVLFLRPETRPLSFPLSFRCCSSVMAPASTVFASQAGGRSVINYSYTDLPWRLVAYDIYQFFRLAWALPYILLPTSPRDSGDLDELSCNFGNVFCIAVHVVLCVLQLAFILSLPS